MRFHQTYVRHSSHLRLMIKRDVTLNFTSKEKNYEKKVLLGCFAVLTAVSLAGCSGDNGKKVESKKSVEKTTEKSTEKDDSKAGEIVEENGMKKVPVMTDKKLNMTGKTGPIKYSIDGIQVSKFTATTDELADTLEIEKKQRNCFGSV